MTFTLEELEPLVGSLFTVQTSRGPIELRLASATEQARKNLPDRFRTPLSLVFDGPDDIVLAQDNYEMSHPNLGQHVLAIIPIVSDREGPFGRPQYEILFT